MNVKSLLGVAALLGLLGWNATRLSGPEGALAQRSHPVWSLALPGVLTVLAAPLGPGGSHVLVTHTLGRLLVMDADGRPLADKSWSRLAAIATGDLDGDRREELVALTDSPARVTALEPALTERWNAAPALPWPSRVLVADLDGDGRAEVVVAGGAGVEAFTHDGRALWLYRFPRAASGEQAELRGLDDVRVGRERRVAVARRDGTLALLAPDGRELLDRTYEGGLRRLRTTDLDDDHQGEILLGREDGTFMLLDAQGAPRFAASLGEAIGELRELDLDGHKATVELVLGGKRGAVQVESARLGTLRTTHMPAKITALGAVDIDGDGRPDLAMGDEDGHVQLEASDGRVLFSLAGVGKVERLIALPEPGTGLRNLRAARAGRALLVASANGLAVWRLRPEPAPAWYSPWVAGLLGAVALALVGLLLRGLRAPKAGPTLEALQADYGREARAQIEAWINAGQLTREQAAERLRQLARDVEADPAPRVRSPPAPPRQA